MSEQSKPDDLPPALDEALAWHVRLGAPDVSESVWAEFTAWLEKSPAHRAAFEEAEQIDSDLTSVAPGFSHARRHAGSGFRHEFVRKAAPWAASLLAAACVVLAVLVWAPAPGATEYATRIGETRTVKLVDGSILRLNTNTRLTVQITSQRRKVTLASGEAFFDVVHNELAPFEVVAGGRRIRDVGTAFDVWQNAGSTTIIVAEGAVSVRSVAGAGETVPLGAGHQLVHWTRSGSDNLSPVDVATALAWRHGYLVFRKVPLSAVVAELNRYFPNPVSAAVHDGRGPQFTGVLKLASEKVMLHTLAAFLHLRVTNEPGHSITLRPAPDP